MNVISDPQPPPPLSDAQKKTLRHLDTLVEVLSNKIVDQMELKQKREMNSTDPSGGIGSSREYKRQREQQGNVDVVSSTCMFDMSFASSRIFTKRIESYIISFNVVTRVLKQYMRFGFTWYCFRSRRR
jgi:hypothetical protein